MRYLLLLFCFLITVTSSALTLKEDCPKRYVIQRGDTLWSIACKFLKNPWEWKALWRVNPQIKNPNRLYAGDTLILDYYNNTPYIKVLSGGTIKLSPYIRVSEIPDLIPPIPLNDIKPFLNESLVLDHDTLKHTPYVLAFMGEHMLGGQGDEVYVRGLHPCKDLPGGGTIAYSIFRKGPLYIDPRTKRKLGYKATLVGYGELVAGGEPATIILTKIVEGIKKEDSVLINKTPEFPLYFEPETPSVKVNGLIIDMPSSMAYENSQQAVGEIIVINVGARHGVKAGDVLGLYGKTRTVKDPKDWFTPIKLPPERIGEAMIFRTFTNTSFALIVRSIRAVYKMDVVTNP